MSRNKLVQQMLDQTFYPREMCESTNQNMLSVPFLKPNWLVIPLLSFITKMYLNANPFHPVSKCQDLMQDMEPIIGYFFFLIILTTYNY